MSEPKEWLSERARADGQNARERAARVSLEKAELLLLREIAGDLLKYSAPTNMVGKGILLQEVIHKAQVWESVSRLLD